MNYVRDTDHPSVLFFGEDWGRHPSTAQYLATELLDSRSITWINSIGLREPSISTQDLGRVAGKLRRALQRHPAEAGDSLAAVTQPQHIVSPWILPLHRFAAARALNQRLFQRQMRGEQQLVAGEYTVVTANPASFYLLDVLQPRRSLYYCADKYAHIAGLDADLVTRFERELLQRVDVVVGQLPTPGGRPAQTACRGALPATRRGSCQVQRSAGLSRAGPAPPHGGFRGAAGRTH